MKISACRHNLPNTELHECDAERLADFLCRGRVVTVTGAGCSTESGIPDYRDHAGNWKRPQPVRFQDFFRSEDARRRYWARSFAGWDVMSQASPNPAHHALAALENSGHVAEVVTQNVDGLHQRAGSRNVIDLHGRIDRVVCIKCSEETERENFQEILSALNPGWERQVSRFAPDGDADLAESDLSGFQVPPCPRCGGVLKPDVVFFGENVPRDRVERAFDCVRKARALLVVGSSLMVWSGFRFIKAAAEQGLPLAAINLGRTRTDDLVSLKIEISCGEILPSVVRLLGFQAGE